LTNDDENDELSSSSLLSSLAKKYNLKDEESNNTKLSSSIDNLLNSFFSSSNTQKADTTTSNNNKEFDLNDLIDSELSTVSSKTNENTNANAATFITRTKSISICFETTPSISGNTNTINRSQHSESLKDLANEYLATANTDSSENVQNDVSSSLVEMIDHEFSQRFNLNSESELTASNGERPFDLNHLLLNNQSRLKRKSSLSLSNNNCSSLCSSNSSLAASNSNAAAHHNHHKEPLKLIKTIRQEEKDVSECLRNIFALKNKSMFGQFLSATFTTCYLNNKNKNTENLLNFNYGTQKDANQRNKKVHETKRKRIVIDYDLEMLKRREKAKANAASTIKTNSSSGGKKKVKLNEKDENNDEGGDGSLDTSIANTIKKIKKQEKTSTAGVLKPIKAFDFSIPSPDDVVIAKQKFAFKNIRFK
jgi:hypothetical protein